MRAAASHPGGVPGRPEPPGGTPGQAGQQQHRCHEGEHREGHPGPSRPAVPASRWSRTGRGSSPGPPPRRAGGFGQRERRHELLGVAQHGDPRPRARHRPEQIPAGRGHADARDQQPGDRGDPKPGPAVLARAPPAPRAAPLTSAGTRPGRRSQRPATAPTRLRRQPSGPSARSRRRPASPGCRRCRTACRLARRTRPPRRGRRTPRAAARDQPRQAARDQGGAGMAARRALLVKARPGPGPGR